MSLVQVLVLLRVHYLFERQHNEWIPLACYGNRPADKSKRAKRVQGWYRKKLVGWLYSLLFSCIFNLGKLLMPFCAPMLRYQLDARFYK